MNSEEISNGRSNAELQHAKMTRTPIPRLVIALSIPTTVSQLVTVLYNTVDAYFVSKINISATGAIGVAFSAMSLIQAFGYGISMGSSSLISRALGESKNDEADIYANSGLLFAAVFGLVIGLTGFYNLKALMKLLGSTDTILPYACEYTGYIFIGAPIMCFSFLLTFILRSEGKAKLATIALSMGAIVNVFLDPLLIFHFKMGISGAAIATVASQTVGLIILAGVFVSGKTVVSINPKKISSRPRDYWMILSTGLPTVFRQGFGSVSTAIMNSLAGNYGDAAVAAVTISSKIYMFVRNIILGIGQGFLPVAGYNYGNGNMKRTRQSFVFSSKLGTLICLVCMCLCYGFALQITNMFTHDTETERLCLYAIRVCCIVMPFLAYSTYVNQLYQGLGFRLAATLLASCRQGIFFIPLIYLLSSSFGIYGILATQPAADIALFLISIPSQIVIFKKHLKL